MSFRNTKRMGCPCNSNATTMNDLRAYRRRFLGDDTGGDGGDGGGSGTDFSSGGFDFSGGAVSGSAADTGLTPDILNQINAGTYEPAPTDTFSQAQPGTTVAPSSTFDQFGGVDIGGGAYINSYGDQIMPDGTVYMTDGWTLNADGSVTDPNNQTYPASSPTAQSVATSAAARSGGGSGGGSSSGAPKSGGSGSSNLQQALCMLNPTLPQCRTAQPKAQTPAKPATSSFSSFMTQWGGWIAAGIAAAVILPPLLDSGGRR